MKHHFRDIHRAVFFSAIFFISVIFLVGFTTALGVSPMTSLSEAFIPKDSIEQDKVSVGLPDFREEKVPQQSLFIKSVQESEVNNQSCTYSLGPGTYQVSPASGGIIQVALTASATNCAWTATANSQWFRISSTPSGEGSATVSVSVDPNTGPSRSGTVTIGGMDYGIAQSNGCSFTLSPSSSNIPAIGQAGTFSVNSSNPSCQWTANRSTNWLTITSGSTGVGNGTVSYSVSQNTGSARSASISVNGRPFIINQASGCTFSLSSNSATVPASGGSLTFMVNTGDNCTWTASNSENWISIYTERTRTGTRSVDLVVAKNDGIPRSGTIVVEGQQFSVIQGGEPSCGALDPRFGDWLISYVADNNPGPRIKAMTVDRNGMLYVGGEFSSIGGVPANNVAKWDGEKWNALGVGTDGPVSALFVQGESLVVGGRFLSAGGAPAGGIAKWVGDQWLTDLPRVYPASWGSVTSIGVDTDGSLLATGYLQPDGMRNPGWTIIKWSGSQWQPLSNDSTPYEAPGGGSSNVRLFDGNVVTLNYTGISKWDGQRWTFMPAPSGLIPTAFESFAGKLYVLAYLNLDYKLYRIDGDTWVDIPLPVPFQGLNIRAVSLAVDNEGILVGSRNLGFYRGYSPISRYDGNAFSPVDYFRDELYGIPAGNVDQLIADSSGKRVFFLSTNSVYGSSGIYIQTEGLYEAGDGYWRDLLKPKSQDFNPMGGDPYRSTKAYMSAHDSGQLYLALEGGGGATIDGGFTTQTTSIVRWNGSSWLKLAEVKGYVSAMTVFNGRLVISAASLSFADGSVGGTGSWDGTQWVRLGDQSSDSVVRKFFILNNEIYGISNFYYEGMRTDSIPFNYFLVKFTDSGLVKIDFPEQISGPGRSVGAVASDGQNVYFVNHVIVPGTMLFQGYLTKWDGISFSPSTIIGRQGEYNFIRDISLAGSDIWIWGNFSTVDGVEAKNIARFDGAKWNAVDTTQFLNWRGDSTLTGFVADDKRVIVTDGKDAYRLKGTSWESFITPTPLTFSTDLRNRNLLLSESNLYFLSVPQVGCQISSGLGRYFFHQFLGTSGSSWHQEENWSSEGIAKSGSSVSVLAPEAQITSSDVTVADLMVPEGRTLTIGSGRKLTITSALIVLGEINGEGVLEITNCDPSSVFNRGIGKVSVEMTRCVSDGSTTPLNNLGKVKQLDEGEEENAKEYLFPVGGADGLRPVTVSNIAGNGKVTIKPVQGVPEGLSGLTASVNRYWDISQSGVKVADLSFGLKPGDIDTSLSSSYKAIRVVKGEPQSTGDLVDRNTNSVTVADESTFGAFTVVPASDCIYDINTVVPTMSASGEATRILVPAPTGCGWKATSKSSWLQITDGVVGEGPGAVHIAVGENLGPARSGILNISGRKVRITQSGGCSFSISPSSVELVDGRTEEIRISASRRSCKWSTSNPRSPVYLEGSTTGTGSGTVSIRLLGHYGPAKDVVFKIAGQDFTARIADNCAQSINPGFLSLGAESTTQSVSVGINSECGGWVASTSVGWITLEKPSGLSQDQVRFVVSANPGPARNGTVTISGKTLYVYQEGGSANQGLIEGTVRYFFGQTPVAVPGVTLSASGSQNVSGMSSFNGVFSIIGFGAGAYTLMPSKSGDATTTAISALDASTVAQYSVQLVSLTANQQIAADVTNDGTISALDASRIAQWSVGLTLPEGDLTGTWKFTPSSRTYSSVTEALSSQDFTAILLGDVTGNWTAPASLVDEWGSGAVEQKIGDQPSVVSGQSDLAKAIGFGMYFERFKVSGIRNSWTEFAGRKLLGNGIIEVPIIVSEATGIFAYDAVIDFDPAILELATEGPIQSDGTLSTNLNLVANIGEPGRIRIAAYGITPITGDGNLLVLRFRARKPNAYINEARLQFNSLTINEKPIISPFVKKKD